MGLALEGIDDTHTGIRAGKTIWILHRHREQKAQVPWCGRVLCRSTVPLGLTWLATLNEEGAGRESLCM
jgi:hypothetical protein